MTPTVANKLQLQTQVIVSPPCTATHKPKTTFFARKRLCTRLSLPTHLLGGFLGGKLGKDRALEILAGQVAPHAHAFEGPRPSKNAVS